MLAIKRICLLFIYLLNNSTCRNNVPDYRLGHTALDLSRFWLTRSRSVIHGICCVERHHCETTASSKPKIKTQLPLFTMHAGPSGWAPAASGKLPSYPLLKQCRAPPMTREKFRRTTLCRAQSCQLPTVTKVDTASSKLHDGYIWRPGHIPRFTEVYDLAT